MHSDDMSKNTFVRKIILKIKRMVYGFIAYFFKYTGMST